MSGFSTMVRHGIQTNDVQNFLINKRGGYTINAREKHELQKCANFVKNYPLKCAKMHTWWHPTSIFSFGGSGEM